MPAKPGPPAYPQLALDLDQSTAHAQQKPAPEVQASTDQLAPSAPRREAPDTTASQEITERPEVYAAVEAVGLRTVDETEGGAEPVETAESDNSQEALNTLSQLARAREQLPASDALDAAVVTSAAASELRSTTPTPAPASARRRAPAGSVHNLLPIEPGGEEARRGLDFQDHVAAGFLLDLLLETDAATEAKDFHPVGDF